MTSVLSTLLSELGVPHNRMAGLVCETATSKIVRPHLWISFSGGWVLDIRLRLWLGEHAAVPHGVFIPAQYGMEYYGEALLTPLPSRAVVDFLCDQRLGAVVQRYRPLFQKPRKSSREISLERVRVALKWIYDWGWSSGPVIETLLDTKRTPVTPRLVRYGLVKKTRTKSSEQPGMPEHILTLTELGVQEVERDLEEEISLLPRANPYRVGHAVLHSKAQAQMATATALKNGVIDTYQTDRQLARIRQAK